MKQRTVLFLHQAFPGQFTHLAQSLVKDGHKIYALTLNPQANLAGVTLIRYGLTRQQQTNLLPYILRELDAKTLRGESAYQAMIELRDKGVRPDVIYAHPGWGEALFVRNVWPKARLVIYAEWFYHLEGQEVNFDPEFPPLTPQDELRLTLKNTVFLHALNEADAAISPTQWQKSRFPAWAQEKIEVIHDGLDLVGLDHAAPKNITIPDRQTSLRYGMPIITFVARHLEPVRGFHVLMRALPAILRARPDAHVLILGRDAGISSGYGQYNAMGTTWRQALLGELRSSLDMNRIHFPGFVDRATYLAMLRLSACHVYLTTPFILSWSFLEAAAMGLPIVASATAPVLEFKHLRGVETVPFGKSADLAQKILEVLSRQTERTPNVSLEQQLDITWTLPRVKEILFDGLSDAPFPEEAVDLSTTTSEPTHSPKKKRVMRLRRRLS